jgi:hypothetical protein
MDLIFLLHDRLATTVILFFAIAGLWGLLEFARGGALSGSIAGILIIGQGLVVVQGLLGVVLYLAGYRPATIVHVLTAAIVLPFLWSYVRDRAPRQGLLLYSLVALFIVGLAIRGMTTGS